MTTVEDWTSKISGDTQGWIVANDLSDLDVENMVIDYLGYPWGIGQVPLTCSPELVQVGHGHSDELMLLCETCYQSKYTIFPNLRLLRTSLIMAELATAMNYDGVFSYALCNPSHSYSACLVALPMRRHLTNLGGDPAAPIFWVAEWFSHPRSLRAQGWSLLRSFSDYVVSFNLLSRQSVPVGFYGEKETSERFIFYLTAMLQEQHHATTYVTVHDGAERFQGQRKSQRLYEIGISRI